MTKFRLLPRGGTKHTHQCILYGASEAKWGQKALDGFHAQASATEQMNLGREMKAEDGVKGCFIVSRWAPNKPTFWP